MTISSRFDRLLSGDTSTILHTLLLLLLLLLANPTLTGADFVLQTCRSDLEGPLFPGQSLTLGCRTSEAFDFCEIGHGDGDNWEKCRFDWPSYDSGIRRSDCSEKLSSRLQFVGHANKTTFECLVELVNVTSEDTGVWKLTMEEYVAVETPFTDLDVVQKEWNLEVMDTKPEDNEDEVLVVPRKTDCYETGIAYMEYDLHDPTKTDTAGLCQQKCEKDDLCHHWTWTEQFRSCYLKNATALSGRARNDGRISGPKFCPGCFTLGRRMSGGSYVGSVTTIAECQAKCQLKRDNCQFIHYRLDYGYCYLFKTMGPVANYYQSAYGPKVCEEAFWSDWSHWSSCSTRCIQENQRRIRECLRVNPGASCLHGLREETRVCGNLECKSENNSWDQSGHGTDQSRRGTGVLGTLLFSLLLFLMLAVAVTAFIFKRKKQFPMAHYRITSTFRRQTSKEPTYVTTKDFRKQVRDEIVPKSGEYRLLGNDDYRRHVMVLSKSVAKSYSKVGDGNMNRYVNILPYDESRVVLKSPVKGCDYVNASWITYDEERDPCVQFIAAQGPLPQTVQHFLQMIAENDIKLVLMLTKTEEMSKNDIPEPKCEPYWNSEAFSISTLEEAEFPAAAAAGIRGLTRRVCQLTTGRTKHQFTQYQFTNWPDFGVPDSPGPMVDLAKLVRQELKGPPAPKVLVHCSAGVGRTGTFIGLYRIMEQVDRKQELIDVYDEVMRLRKDRPMMVQKPAQYRYLYQCVAHYLREVDGTKDNLESDYVYSI